MSSLANETAAMMPENASILFELGDDATEQHVKAKDAVCGKGGDVDLVQWARNWRKRIEPLYYVCSIKSKKAKLHEDLAELFDVAKPKPLDLASLFDPSAQSDIDAHAKRIIAISQRLSKWCPVPKKPNDKWDGKKEPMTQSDAVVEAGRRWKSGAIETSKSGKKRVGYVQMNFFNVMGEGTTWEEAFAEADKKAESDKRWSKEIEEGRKKNKLNDKATLPVCNVTEAKKLERCILKVKAKGTAVNPFAVCQVSVGCKKPKTSLNEVSPGVRFAIANAETVKLNDAPFRKNETPSRERYNAVFGTHYKPEDEVPIDKLRRENRQQVCPDCYGYYHHTWTEHDANLRKAGVLQENEAGYCVCKDGDTLLKEKVVSGEAHSITIPVSCSTGKVAALVHLHPSGNIEASRQDLETSKRLGVPVCVVVSGQKVKCYQAR